ncbi:MAG: PIN domain-containing protein [Cyanobacteria bacterium P01_A01_bin.84]
MIRILIDADLILEALMNRNSLVKDINDLFDKFQSFMHIYMTDVGWQKIHAYASRMQNKKNTNIVLNWLKEKIKVYSVTKTILQQARSSSLPDFESAVESLCANKQKFDAIVTHNPKNFIDVTNKLWIWSVKELCVRASLESQLQTSKFSRDTYVNLPFYKGSWGDYNF